MSDLVICRNTLTNLCSQSFSVPRPETTKAIIDGLYLLLIDGWFLRCWNVLGTSKRPPRIKASKLSSNLPGKDWVIVAGGGKFGRETVGSQAIVATAKPAVAKAGPYANYKPEHTFTFQEFRKSIGIISRNKKISRTDIVKFAAHEAGDAREADFSKGRLEIYNSLLHAAGFKSFQITGPPDDSGKPYKWHPGWVELEIYCMAQSISATPDARMIISGNP